MSAWGRAGWASHPGLEPPLLGLSVQQPTEKGTGPATQWLSCLGRLFHVKETVHSLVNEDERGAQTVLTLAAFGMDWKPA